jgi:hypothetical protein
METRKRKQSNRIFFVLLDIVGDIYHERSLISRSKCFWRGLDLNLPLEAHFKKRNPMKFTITYLN